jgi:D-arabinose 1-dehydrogenase-like Zn-dependent alcohol dehydrogenase
MRGLAMLANGYKLESSLVASREMHDDMLEFAAWNQIRPVIKTFGMTASGFAEALAKLRNGTIRYRGVLVAH